MKCWFRRQWISLKMTTVTKSNGWDKAKLTGHRWQQITTVNGNEELEQCQDCKIISKIIHL